MPGSAPLAVRIQGIDEMTVQEIIGHTKGSNITRRVYSHLRKETKKERMLAAIKSQKNERVIVNLLVSFRAFSAHAVTMLFF